MISNGASSRLRVLDAGTRLIPLGPVPGFVTAGGVKPFARLTLSTTGFRAAVL